MKSAYRRTRMWLLLVALVLIVSSPLLYLAIQPPPSETPASFNLAYSPISGQEVSLSQARAIVPFKLNLPTILGQFAQLKLDKYTNAVTIIFAANKPEADADVFDVLSHHAIILFEMPNLSLEDSRQNTIGAINSTKNDVGGGLQPVTINGYFGCKGGNVWHTVSWYTRTTYYQLAANINYPLEQLVSIANSIPV